MRGRKNLVAARVTQVLHERRVSPGRGGRIVARGASHGMRGGAEPEHHRGGRLVSRESHVWCASAAREASHHEFDCQNLLFCRAEGRVLKTKTGRLRSLYSQSPPLLATRSPAKRKRLVAVHSAIRLAPTCASRPIYIGYIAYITSASRSMKTNFLRGARQPGRRPRKDFCCICAFEAIGWSVRWESRVGDRRGMLRLGGRGFDSIRRQSAHGCRCSA